MKIILNILLVFVFVSLFMSCNSEMKNKDKQYIDKDVVNEAMIDVNKNLILQESNMIDEFVKNNKLDVIRTGTGLRYQIFEKGNGDFISKGDIVTMEYSMSLMNGELLYSSNDEGNKTFVVGRGGVESGLEEAILQMRKNSTSLIIIPSYLAHGLVGDGNKIPPKAVIVYKLKIIDIDKDNNIRENVDY